jgi:hypothetical protein
MRKSQAIEMNESILGTPTQTNQSTHKTRRCCLFGIWLMSNALTFVAGYYVKTKYFNDTCLIDEYGSM